MRHVKVRVVNKVSLSHDGVTVTTYEPGDEFTAPEKLVRGQIGLGNLEPVDASVPMAEYETKPAARETAVRHPRHHRR